MPIATDERREYSRFCRDQVACMVTIDGKSQRGYIVEESIGGLRVSGIQLDRLRQNQKITVESEGQVINGYCRNLDFDESGKFAIGILCAEEKVRFQLGGHLLACFLKHKDQSFICFPIDVNDSHCRARLIDGKEFSLPRDLIEYKTRSRRWSELSGNHSFIKTLAKLYQIEDTEQPRLPEEWVNEIVNFEFKA